MATTLVLRSLRTSGIHKAAVDFYNLEDNSFGSATDTLVTNTAASGTQIQTTVTAGGSVTQFVSKRVATGFTLTSLTAINLWFHENSMNANCGGRIRIFKLSPDLTETELGGGPFDDGVEFGTVAAQMDWTANPTDTAFAEDDRILLKVYITNVGTMAAGFTCTLTFNGASGATGDSLITVNETISFKAEKDSTGDVLLLHGNGTDGSTTFTDSSSQGHVFTAGGNTQLDTAQQKFGTASILFDGTGDFLTLATHSQDFAFQAGDFTIDFWLRLNATGVTQVLVDFRDVGMVSEPAKAIAIYVSSADKLIFHTDHADQITGTTSLTTGQWYHVAVTRSGTDTRLFLNGTQESSTETGDTRFYVCGPGAPYFGKSNFGAGDSFLNGWLDEVHIKRGVADWTANFTPPTSEYGGNVGAASGTGTATATGTAIKHIAGSAAGAGAATGAGTAIKHIAGSAAGAGAATAAGDAIRPIAGSASGTGAAAAVGESVAGATEIVGSASGAGAASAAGNAITASAGSATGTGAAAAIGAATAAATGAAAGTGTAAGVGAATAAATGSASGTGAATAVGRAIVAGVGSAAGTGAAAGVGATTASAAGSAAGTGAAAALSIATIARAGAASGAGAATGVGAATAAVTGTAAGTGTAAAVSAAGTAVGTATGTGTAAATGVAIRATVGSATGTGAAAGVSEAVGSAGSASGTGTASGVIIAFRDTVGTAAGTGTAAGVSASGTAVGSATGAGTAAGVGAATAAATGSAAGAGTSTGQIIAFRTAAGSAAGTGAASATGVALNLGVGVGTAAGTSSAVGHGAVAPVPPAEYPRRFVFDDYGMRPRRRAGGRG